MRRHLAAACVLLGICASLLGAAAAPAAASPQDSISITSAESPADNVGLLSVQATASTPITSITAELLAAGATTPKLTVTDFGYPSGQTTGTWTVSSPITTAQLPLGSYTISVTATDSGGGTGNNPDAGSLVFLDEPTVTLSPSTSTISYGEQSIGVSGTVTSLPPGGTAAPLANYPVEVSDGFDHTWDLRTDANGRYTGTVTLAPGSDLVASVAATATMASGYSQDYLISTVQDPVKLTAKLSRKHVRYGQRVTVTGTARYKSGAKWLPLSGQRLQVTDGYGYSPAPLADPRVAADGTFRTTIAARTASTIWVVQTNWTGNIIELLGPAQVARPISIAMPVRFRWFSGTLSSFGYLTAKGCLQVPVAGQGAPGSRVQIQYSPRRRGPWHYLGRAQLSSEQGLSRSCDASGEAYFALRIPVRLASAYYRAVFTGNYDFQRATSKSLRRSKLLTRITSFSVSPRSLPRNSYLTASGRLWQQHGLSWRAYAHRKLLILIRYQGAWYYYKHEPRTNSAGRFSGRFKVYVSGPWVAEYVGDRTHFASATRRIRVRVDGVAVLAGPLPAAAPASVAALASPHLAPPPGGLP